MKKLNPQFLRTGLTLPFDLYDKAGKLILKQGFTLQSEGQVDRLADMELFWFDAERKQEVGSGFRRSNPFSLYEQLLSRLDDVLANADNNSGALDQLREIREGVELLWKTSPDPAIAGMLLIPYRNYASLHALHCALIVQAMLGPLHIDPAEHDTAVMAALTMNIGMHGLQNQLFHQQKALDEQQRQVIDDHPRLGADILRRAGVSDPLWLDLIMQHHERWDGSGYPGRLARERIHPLAHLLHVVDIFAAKLWPRAYRCALLPNAALAQVFQGDQIDKQIASQLVKVLGIYPPGTLVRLQNGDVAMVTRRTTHTAAPKVAVLMTFRRAPVWPPVQRDTNSQTSQVVEVVSAAKLNLILPAPSRIWGFEAA